MQNTSHHIGPESFITPEVVAHVESVAASMIGYSGLSADDFDDLCQTFYQYILENAEKYDPSLCSIYTYACRIVDWKKDVIFRDRIKAHLDVPSVSIESDDPDEPSDYEVETAENTVEKEMFRQDVREVVASLPEKYKKFCNLIMEGYSIRAAARRSGIPQGNGVFLYAMPFLRKKFQEAGFSKNF